MTPQKYGPLLAAAISLVMAFTAAPAHAVNQQQGPLEIPSVSGEHAGDMSDTASGSLTTAIPLETEAAEDPAAEVPVSPPGLIGEGIPTTDSLTDVEPPIDGPHTSAPSKPDATLAPTEAVDPATLGEEDLTAIIGILGAKMGQGLERLQDTQDPQEPGAEEIALRIQAEQVLVERGLADVELSIPSQTGPETETSAQPAGASALNHLSPLSGAALEPQQETSLSLAATWQPLGLQGMDVSSYQPSVNWRTVWNQGVRFAYAKATEATSYKNPLFSSQYNGATSVGMVRGAYHFAIPSVSSGATQANYFVSNGGGWSADGRTLPPLLDIEYNPYPQLGNTCYNMSTAQMIDWIKDFSSTVAARTGRAPMIYTTADWWRTCTGNSSAFTKQPLHVAAYDTEAPGPLPGGWSNYTLWQYSSTGPFPGDSNVYKGTLAQLQSFAKQSVVVEPDVLYFRTNPVKGLRFGTSSDMFVTCDWDGDGVATPASFRNGLWKIRASITDDSSVTEIRYGNPGDQPICGDWDGDGKDTIGVFRRGVAYLKNQNTSGKADGVFAFGDNTDTALVGDWNGDGYDTLGVARDEGPIKRFYLTDSNIRPTVTNSFLYGNAGDNAIAGDWNNDGKSTVGVHRANVWYLSSSNVRAVATSVFTFGNIGDRPITGRWARGQSTSVGVIR